MMMVIVTACSAFGFTVSDRKTDDCVLSVRLYGLRAKDGCHLPAD